MLWPPPVHGERVTLTCACQAAVLWHVPLVFLYCVRVAEKSAGCVHAGHAAGKRVLTTLEALASRADSASAS